MVEIIPVMLLILGWHPDRPGEIDLQRPEIVFTAMDECVAAGQAMAERMNAAAGQQSGARYEFRCMTVPASSEYETAFAALDGKRK